jgi:hypothetical protein
MHWFVHLRASDPRLAIKCGGVPGSQDAPAVRAACRATIRLWCSRRWSLMSQSPGFLPANMKAPSLRRHAPTWLLQVEQTPTHYLRLPKCTRLIRQPTCPGGRVGDQSSLPTGRLTNMILGEHRMRLHSRCSAMHLSSSCGQRMGAKATVIPPGAATLSGSRCSCRLTVHNSLSDTTSGMPFGKD